MLYPGCIIIPGCFPFMGFPSAAIMNPFYWRTWVPHPVLFFPNKRRQHQCAVNRIIEQQRSLKAHFHQSSLIDHTIHLLAAFIGILFTISAPLRAVAFQLMVRISSPVHIPWYYQTPMLCPSLRIRLFPYSFCMAVCDSSSNLRSCI